MQTSRRIDQVDDHAKVAERVRKLEVMPNPQTLEAARWTPSREDLWAIAGHVYMLGCYPNPTHTSATPISGARARIDQASQVLWALLDQRGNFGAAEGEQWLGFLKQLGAIPDWSGASPLTFTAGPAGPTCRLGYTPSFSHMTTGDRAITLTGIPIGSWIWVHEGNTLVAGATGIRTDAWDEASIPLWAARGGIEWGQVPGVFYLDTVEPVIGANNTWGFTPPYTPCGEVIPAYKSRLYPGNPVPYNAGHTPCWSAPSGMSSFQGSITRVRLTFGGWDLRLLEPPRIQTLELRSNEFSGPVFGDGPGLDWLADGVDAILGDYPAVSGFYANALPQAYAAKLQHTHYRWQSLPVSINWRGRVEAHLEGDRIILKGQITHPGVFVDPTVFYMPIEWDTVDSSYYFATDHAGQSVPVQAVPSFVGADAPGEAAIDPRRYRPFAIYNNWLTAVDYEGPATLRFDGTVIPRRMTPS